MYVYMCVLLYPFDKFLIVKLWKEPKCPSTDEWIKKMWYTHTHTHTHTHTQEYYSVMKKNEILPFVIMWVELECIMLSKISQKKINIM